MHDLKPLTDDGLVIAEVGEWSRDKHHFLSRYLNAFTTAMTPKRWGGLHYIDLFAGSGIERLKNSGQLEWGSPLLAAQTPRPFSRLHLCEKDKKKHEALVQRVRCLDSSADPQILCGDANECVHEIIRTIPPRSLSVAFLDPYGLHLHYETLRVLSGKRVDLIVFFPDHMDALRNQRLVYREDADSNLDIVLGAGVDWRDALDNAPQEKWAEVLRQLYERQIRLLGYSHFGYERISHRGHPFYLLIYCCRKEVGLTIWENTSRIHPDGQRTIDFK